MWGSRGNERREWTRGEGGISVLSPPHSSVTLILHLPNDATTNLHPFVLGLGDSLGDNQPNAQLSVDVDEAANNSTINHNGGDSIPADTLSVVISSGGDSERGDVVSRLSVGDSAQASLNEGENGFTVDESEDYRIRIIHTPSDSILLDRTFQAENGLTVSDEFSFSV